MSETGCDLCVFTGASDSDDGPSFTQDHVQKARKEYRCCECRETIPIGALYERTIGKWDGEFNQYITCLACAEIRSTFCCDGWIYGDLWEDFAESGGFERMTTACLDKLETAAAKQKLLDNWNAWRF